ncbi:MAG: hypothetical protein AAGD92_15420 [Pseudomonadota bacterium]
MATAELIVLLLGVWFGVGALVAAAFLALGVKGIDEAANGASVFFRPMIFLGCAMLWPAVAIRWLSRKKINEPIEEDA